MTEVPFITSEFDQFLEALPPLMAEDLAQGQAASTAFYGALKRSGWRLPEIIFDVQAKVRGGGRAGVVLNELRRLATTTRPDGDNDARALLNDAPVYVPGRFFAPEPRTDLTPQDVAERRNLLTEIMASKASPDDAEAWMKALIARQKASHEQR